MIEFGKTLKAAREAKGLSVEQVAQQTHMMSRMIVNLENEQFGEIAAPIYGRGFVRLYCEAVDLDPKPMIAEFMEIFSGNRAPSIHLREVQPVVEEAPVPEPESGSEQTPGEEATDTTPLPVQADFFRSEEPKTVVAPPVNLPKLAANPQPAANPRIEPPAAPTPPSISRYAAPLSEEDEIEDSPLVEFLRMINWRFFTLIAAAVAIIWLMTLLGRAAFTAPTKESADKNETAEATEETPAALPAEKRVPNRIPALYFD